jgi:hypothetical protein
VDAMRHQGDVGWRVHEESIRLQQHLATVPLPVEKPKDHRLLRSLGALLLVMVLVALALVLLPPGTGA